jgi:hypothetical protein
LTASGAGVINLTAPASGSYAGLLIWQPSSNTNAVNFGNSATVTLNGVAYLPGAQFVNSGASPTWSNFTIIAKSYNISGSATITSAATSPYFTGGGLAGNFLLQ